MSRIEPRPGVEVFLNKGGTISIAQIDESSPSDAPIVDLHPGDVPKLIKLLKEAQAEAASLEGAELEVAPAAPSPTAAPAS